MKESEEKLDLPPTHPEVQARVLEFFRSMTREELIEFLEYRTPGVKEYWLGKPIRKKRRPKAASEKKDPASAS